MTFTDGSGKSAADYKALILGDFSQKELDLRDDWYSFVDMLRAGMNGQKREYKLTFAEDPPSSGAYIKVMMPCIMDGVEDGFSYIQEMTQLLNKLFTLPSGLTPMAPGSQPIDWDMYEEPYQGDIKVKYIVAAWHREQGSSDSWVSIPLTHNQTIYNANVAGAYDTGSYLIWNHSTLSHFWLAYALGKEISNKWGLEDGIDSTIMWHYATDESPPRYLRGDDSYWLTHGFPNGRKYRLYRDLYKHDYKMFRYTAGIIALILYLGLPKKIISKVISIVNGKMKMAKMTAPANEILDRLETTADDPEAFRGLIEIVNNLENVLADMETKANNLIAKIEEVTYKPYNPH